MVLVALVHLIGSNPVFASGAGSLVGAILNYFLNYRFTFNSNEAHKIALPRFLLVVLIGFNLNILIMYIGVDVYEVYYLFVQVIATGVVLIWNFSGNRFWTFANDKFYRPEGKHDDAALDGSCATHGSKGFRSWFSRLT